MDPETEDAVDTEGIVFAGVPCRVDSILYRRSIEANTAGGAPGIRRAIIFIQDARLSYPTNFNENNWIVQNGIRYEILSIDEADDMFTMHHYEVNCQAGRYR
jgi:hypothetical protein